MGGYRPTPVELDPPVGGPLEVTVFRHSDPVQVRRASSNGAFPLRFFAKRQRVKSGGMMLVGPGGRGEVIWSDSGTNAVLFDEGALEVGEPGRGDPTIILRSITRGHFLLAPSDRLRLLGGAELTTAAEVVTGPFVVEMVRPDLLRIRNQTKQQARIAYLDEIIELGSAQLVDLPLLPQGVDPYPVDPDFVSVGVVAPELSSKGASTTQAVGDGVLFQGNGPTTVRGRGLRLVLGAGDYARFDPLGKPEPPSGPGPTAGSSSGP